VRLAKGDAAAAAARLRRMAATALESAVGELRDGTDNGGARHRMDVAGRFLQAAADLDEWSWPCVECGGQGPLSRTTLRCRTCQRERWRERIMGMTQGLVAMGILGVMSVGPLLLVGLVAGRLTGGDDRAENLGLFGSVLGVWWMARRLRRARRWPWSVV